MNKHILITGGAGFIGSHIAEELLQHGYRVRVLDNLSRQVHGPHCGRPRYLDPEVELMVGDVRSPERVGRALIGIDAVFHLAAVIGNAQNMYDITQYTSTNNLGTAVLLEALRHYPMERLVVASSMSLYGEGPYCEPGGTPCDGIQRTPAQLKAGDWEIRNGAGEALLPLPTPETKIPSPSSLYALSKYDQERMCHLIGRAYDIPTVALRFFNVFGSRQTLSNPYTSVLPIFASRLLHDIPPLIYEDGHQQRDFVHVLDIARACRSALEEPTAAGHTINIGSGRPVSIREAAKSTARVLGKEHIRARLIGKYRAGDVRHCFADISLARKVLGYEPQISFDEGLLELAAWLESQVVSDHFDEAGVKELAAGGLSL